MAETTKEQRDAVKAEIKALCEKWKAISNAYRQSRTAYCV